MKTQLLMVLATFGLMSSAFAMGEGSGKVEKICGELESRIDSPQCITAPCPHFLKKVYSLKTANDEITLETKNPKILVKFGKMEDELVCATGKVSEGSVMDVTSVVRVMSAQ